jgi:hypothetical protein
MQNRRAPRPSIVVRLLQFFENDCSHESYRLPYCGAAPFHRRHLGRTSATAGKCRPHHRSLGPGHTVRLFLETASIATNRAESPCECTSAGTSLYQINCSCFYLSTSLFILNRSPANSSAAGRSRPFVAHKRLADTDPSWCSLTGYIFMLHGSAALSHQMHVVRRYPPLSVAQGTIIKFVWTGPNGVDRVPNGPQCPSDFTPSPSTGILVLVPVSNGGTFSTPPLDAGVHWYACPVSSLPSLNMM